MGAELGNASPDDTIGAWAALGIAFDAPPRGHAPDLERLLLSTARQLPGLPRLLPTVVTWLRIYGDAVACHRLRRLVAEELQPSERPVLGLLLTLADHGVRPARFATVLRGLRPCAAPRPLFSVEAETPSLAARARGGVVVALPAVSSARIEKARGAAAPTSTVQRRRAPSTAQLTLVCCVGHG